MSAPGQVVVAPHRTVSRPEKAVFLAGGISDVGDWQRLAAERLRSSWAAVYNPRRDDFPMGDETAGAEQIRWEYEHLAAADAILFWFSYETLQPISLFELGCWATTAKPIAVGAHPGYPRRFDVVQQLALIRPGLAVHADLASTCAAANALA